MMMPFSSPSSMSMPGAPIQEEGPIKDQPVSAVTFISIKPENTEHNPVAEAVKEAAKAAALEVVKVKVCGKYRVIHEGKAYVGGDVVEAPKGTAEVWIRSGWAEPIPSRKASN